MHENLLQYVSKFIQLTPLDKEAIELNFKPIKLKRKGFLLKEGNIWFKSLSTELCKFDGKTFKFSQEEK